MPGYLDVRMQTKREWVALGHNTQRGMVSKIVLLKSVSSENLIEYLWKTLDAVTFTIVVSTISFH